MILSSLYSERGKNLNTSFLFTFFTSIPTCTQNVGQHLKKVFSEGELGEDSVVKKFFTTAVDGKRNEPF